MKVIPSRNFLYSLDGIRPTSFKEGVEVNLPDKVVEKLKETGGYLKGFDKKNIEPVQVETIVKDTSLDSILSIDGIKKLHLTALKKAGIENLDQLRELDLEALIDIDGISPKVAEILKAEKE